MQNQPIEIRNPSNHKLLGQFHYERDESVEKKVSLAFLAWQKQRSRLQKDQVQDRLAALAILAENLKKSKKSLSETISHEMGKPLKESLAEIEKSISACEYYFLNGAGFLAEEQIAYDDKKALIQKDSFGVVLAIMPWNFPLWQVIRAWLSASLSGNAFVLKHSDLVHGSAMQMNKIFKESVVDENLFQHLVINHTQAENLIGDSRIRAITLTGSARAGKKIAELCGSHLKKVVLELGGNDAYIVLRDANLSLAVEHCVKSRNMNNGQSCVSAKRFIVHKSVHADFVDLYKLKLKSYLHSDPFAADCVRGPMASLKFKKQLDEQIENIKAKQAVLLAKSEDLDSTGAFISSQLFEVKAEEKALYKDEFFGPIGLLTTFESDAEAIDIANRSQFGLGAAVFSENPETGDRLARQLEVGMVAINQMVQSHPALPFGGTKDSGFGRELSHLGILEFTAIKSLINRA